jgi:hypothetical protein
MVAIPRIRAVESLRPWGRLGGYRARAVALGARPDDEEKRAGAEGWEYVWSF